MKENDKIAYLNKVREISRQIYQKEQELLEVCESLDCMGGASDGDRVQSTPEFDKIGLLLARIDEIEIRIKILKAIKAKYQKAITRKIQESEFDDPRHAIVLKMYYVDEISLIRIARKMDFSVNNIKKMKSKAIKCYANQQKTTNVQK